MKRRKRRKLLQALRQAYEAPTPVEKQEFLERLEDQKREAYAMEKSRAQALGEGMGKISVFRMMAVQLAYLPRWAWGIFATAFFLFFWGSRYLSEEIQWSICACVPFLGMAVIEGSFRSLFWKMEELELASRFSLQSILTARMAALGFGSLLLLLFLAALTDLLGEGQVLFFWVPYLLSSLGCLLVTRRWKGKEGIYAGMAVAACVSCLEMVLYGNFAWLLEPRYMGWWFLAAGVLIVLLLRESARMIKRTEELLWN